MGWGEEGHMRGERGGTMGEIQGRYHRVGGGEWGVGQEREFLWGEEDLAMDRRYHGLGGRGGVRRGEDPWGGRMWMGASEGRSHRLGH